MLRDYDATDPLNPEKPTMEPLGVDTAKTLDRTDTLVYDYPEERHTASP